METTAFSGLMQMACAAAQARGLPQEDLLGQLGLGGVDWSEPSSRISLDVARRSWDVAGRLVDEPLLALKSCSQLDVGALQLVDYWSRSSATIGDALRVVVTCHDFLSTVGSFSLRIEGKSAIFEHSAPSSARQIVELALGMVLDRTRRFSGISWTPQEVRWSHVPRWGARQYEEHFGAKCSFGHATDAIVFDRELLDAPLQTREAQLETILAEKAQAELRELKRASIVRARLTQTQRDVGLENEVRLAIQDCLFEGQPDLNTVALRLGVSRRTLQRQLKDAGTSHRQLLSQVRARVAEDYFAAGTRRRAQIAEALAYSSVRSLERSLATWKKQGAGPFRNQPPRS